MKLLVSFSKLTLMLVWTVGVSVLVDFGEASCSLLLVILVTYSGNTVWWEKADLHYDGGTT